MRATVAEKVNLFSGAEDYSALRSSQFSVV